MSEHPRSTHVIKLIVATALVVFTPTQAATQTRGPESPADPDAPEVMACREAVDRDVLTSRPSSSGVFFATGTIRKWQESKEEMGIRGQAWYLGGRGDWKEITYSCVYDQKAREITHQQVDYPEPATDTAAPPRTKADPNSSPSRSCIEAIESQIRDERPRLEELDFQTDLLRQWVESENETGINGAGEYVGGAGNRKSFIFRCIFNDQKQKVTTASYRVNP
jgi:hypothetical protein